MTTKYWRYTFKGEHTAADAVAKLGEAASHGTVAAIHVKGGETHVFMAADQPFKPATRSAAGPPAPVAATASEVVGD
jgi:hypothetical protein